MSLTRRPAELDLLVKGEHRDPFSVLGPHRPPGGRGVVVRAFLPGASAVELRPDDPGLPARPAARIHPDGVFQAAYPEARGRFAYRLRVTWESGLDSDLQDPYRFPSTLGDLDLLLLGEGTHYRLWDKLGAHPGTLDGVAGVAFAVWAPNARRVSVVGDFNAWDGRRHPMRLHPGNGVWELFLPDLAAGTRYKFEVLPADGGAPFYKADPLAFAFEAGEPRTASTVWQPGGHAWTDADWMAARAARNPLTGPLAIYEVHLGSWRRVPGEGDRFLTYRELGEELGDYVVDLGYTHVELLPILEHPFYGSWGYQALGFFAPTRRHGQPGDFMAFVDALHRRGVGVILDWVPAHFPRDAHGLAWFDGTHLYEHADPRQREHPDWGTLVFNYGRNEVANFLIASALHWLERYHLDGLRVDAVASMLYLDYSKSPGEWVPNRHGGRENLEAIAFIRRFNEVVYREHPGVITIAEESTSWPQVSGPTYVGGLGFGAKWNMGWMHDVLDYFQKDPVHRKYHHDRLTFGLLYAWHENFVLPLSHDEVVHGKGSLQAKMPGDDWQRFANLRALYGFMYGYPGKKLLFMGGEFGQSREWSHDRSLDWHLLDAGPYHRGLQGLVRDLNRLYRAEPALWEVDFEPAGFQWMDCSDTDQSVVSFVRRTRDGRGLVLVVCNFTPVVRRDYRVGVPRPGHYRERINTDAGVYGGGNVGNGGGAPAERVPAQGQPWSIRLTLPPLGVLFLTPDPS